MSKTYKKSVFIFRRDLRLEDNLGLLEALEKSETVVPVFIFDPRQIDRNKNSYFSEPAFHFMLSSLHELDQDLRARGSQLYCAYDQPDTWIKNLLEKDAVSAVYTNKDYTPFSRRRDKDIHEICQEYEVDFFRCDDCALSPLEEIRTNEDSIYTVFTPFMKKAASYDVSSPRKNNFSNYFSGEIVSKTVPLDTFAADIGSRELILHGGRDEALHILHQATFLASYSEQRNLPARTGTSRLSAHHKFGTISIRETYHTAREHNPTHTQFTSELYWRDFYYYIAYHFPVVFKQSFLPWAQYITWQNNTQEFAAWCDGRTGVPMVDAGMRELNTTGWIHNRSRMIVASYLTKNLLIDWRWGEQYFAQNLIDYDPAQNNGGWQWSASTGADPKPIRIFNPYTQATKYDEQAEYIKQWVPELSEVNADILSDGNTQDFSTYNSNYPAPLVDQKDSYHRAKERYQAAKHAWRSKNA